MSEFWGLTPRQTYLAIRAYRRRRGWLAYHIGWLGRCRADDFPKLAMLTGDPDGESPDDQDDGESQLQVTRMWNSVLRGMAAAEALRKDDA